MNSSATSSTIKLPLPLTYSILLMILYILHRKSFFFVSAPQPELCWEKVLNSGKIYYILLATLDLQCSFCVLPLLLWLWLLFLLLFYCYYFLPKAYVGNTRKLEIIWHTELCEGKKLFI